MKRIFLLHQFSLRKLFFIVSFLISGFVNPLNSSPSNNITWIKTIIDEGSCICSILAVGNPYIGFAPSNQNHLYCGESFGNDFVEYSYQNGVWSKNIITPGAFYSIRRIGKGRNDNYDRIYCTDRLSKKVYEIWNENGTWQRNTIFEINSGMICGVNIINGRNDSIKRIYLAVSVSDEEKMIELTYTGPGSNDWQIEEIAMNMSAICMGDGRNDGIMRMYGFGGDNHRTLYELSYNLENEPPWVKREIWDFKSDLIGPVCYGPTIGRARTYDDLNRLYWGDPYGRLNELTWTGYSWENELMKLKEPELIDYSYDLPYFFENNRNDPPTRYLITSSDTIVYICTYNGYEWESEIITSFSREEWEMIWIALELGDVHQTGEYALYAFSSKGEISEFYPIFNDE